MRGTPRPHEAPGHTALGARRRPAARGERTCPGPEPAGDPDHRPQHRRLRHQRRPPDVRVHLPDPGHRRLRHPGHGRRPGLHEDPAAAGDLVDGVAGRHDLHVQAPARREVHVGQPADRERRPLLAPPAQEPEGQPFVLHGPRQGHPGRGRHDGPDRAGRSRRVVPGRARGRALRRRRLQGRDGQGRAPTPTTPRTRTRPPSG